MSTRFESCTCHQMKWASDQHVCRSEALRRCPALSGQNRLFAGVRAEVVRKFEGDPAEKRPRAAVRRHRSRTTPVRDETWSARAGKKDAAHDGCMGAVTEEDGGGLSPGLPRTLGSLDHICPTRPPPPAVQQLPSVVQSRVWKPVLSNCLQVVPPSWLTLLPATSPDSPTVITVDREPESQAASS